MGDRPRPALKLALDEPRLHTPEGNHGELTNDIPCRSTNKEQRKNFTHLHYEGEHLARWPRSSLLQHSVPSSSSRSSKIIWVAQSDMWSSATPNSSNVSQYNESILQPLARFTQYERRPIAN